MECRANFRFQEVEINILFVYSVTCIHVKKRLWAACAGDTSQPVLCADRKSRQGGRGAGTGPQAGLGSASSVQTCSLSCLVLTSVGVCALPYFKIDCIHTTERAVLTQCSGSNVCYGCIFLDRFNVARRGCHFLSKTVFYYELHKFYPRKFPNSTYMFRLSLSIRVHIWTMYASLVNTPDR